MRSYARGLRQRPIFRPSTRQVQRAVSTWFGIWVPNGTPKDIIRKLTSVAMDALGDPAVRQRLEDLGQVIPPREQHTAEALGAYHKAEIEKWWPIIKSGNIKVEAGR